MDEPAASEGSDTSPESSNSSAQEEEVSEDELQDLLVEEEREDLQRRERVWKTGGRCHTVEGCMARHGYPAENNNILEAIGHKEERCGSLLSSSEILWVQWKILERHPDAPRPLAVMSALHAGHGQALAGGPDVRNRVDLTVVESPGHIRFLNFHGSYWHYAGGHAPDCPLVRGRHVHSPSQEEENQPEEEETEEAMLDPQLREALPPEARGRARQDILSPLEEVHVLDRRTHRADEFRRGYVEAINAVDGPLHYTYEVESECAVMHGGDFHAVHSGKRYHNLGDLLRTEHPQEALHAPLIRRITQGALVRKIMRGDADVGGFVLLKGGLTDFVHNKVTRQFSFCQQKSKPREAELGTFTLQQLRELYGSDERLYQAKLKELLDQELNLNRHYYDPRGLECISVPLLRWLVEHCHFRHFKISHYLHYNMRPWFRPFIAPKLQKRHEIKRAKRPGTELTEQVLKLINNGFYGMTALESTNYTKTTIQTDRALCRRRHLYQNAMGVCLLGARPQLRKKKRRRAEEEEEEEDGGPSRRKRRRQEAAALSPNASNDEEETEPDSAHEEEEARLRQDENHTSSRRRGLHNHEETGKLELVYAITRRNTKGSIRNLLQVSAAILSWSRVIFFSKIHWILSVCDRNKVEIMYCGKELLLRAGYFCLLQALFELFGL